MSDTTAVRLGVIGLGNIAKQHISNILGSEVNNCEIVAICSRSAAKFDDLPEIPVFSNYQGLIDSGLCNAVLIATPTYNHCEIGACALNAGLHVLMEKPMGLSVAEGEKLLALKSDQQVFAMMLNQRVDPLFQVMKEVIDSGKLGDLTRCQWTMTNWFRPEVYFQVSDWRATWKGEGGGLLVNQCIHNLDILQWLVGMPSKLRSFCQFGKFHDIEVEDEVSSYLEFANGATGLFVGSTGECPGVNRLDIVGDKGSLAFDGKSLQLTVNDPGTAQYCRETRDMFGMPQTKSEDITPDRTFNQHACVVRNFCDAILDGEALIAPAEEGLNSLAIANAMLLSTWQDCDIEFPLDSHQYQQALEQKIANSSLRKKADIEANIDMSASYR